MSVRADGEPAEEVQRRKERHVSDESERRERDVASAMPHETHGDERDVRRDPDPTDDVESLREVRKRLRGADSALADDILAAHADRVHADELQHHQQRRCTSNRGQSGDRESRADHAPLQSKHEI